MMTEPECPQKSPCVIAETPGEKWWCACGRSKSQPYCDGSHRGTGFQPVLVKIDAERTVAWCACKRSAKKPYCDGTHRRL